MLRIQSYTRNGGLCMNTFNNAIESLKPSASIKYIEKAKIMKMNGENVIGLSGGDPDFPTPKKICDAAYDDGKQT